MSRASMSKLELLSRCQYWARDGVAWTRLTSADAAFGTAIHALAAEYITHGAKAQSLPTPDLSEGERAHLAAVWLLVREWIDANKRLGWRAEVAFAYDLGTGTGRELPSAGDHRDYSAATPTELPGTADLVYMAEDSEGPFACVDDYKWSGCHGDDLRAEAQLAGLGLAWASICGVDRVRCRALRISDDGVDDTSEVYWLDVFSLERVHADLVEQMMGVEAAEPQDGPWCADRWCPAIASCPKTAVALEQIIPASALIARRPEMRLSTEVASPEHAAWMITAIELVEGAAKEIKASLRAFADANEGIPLADGRVWAGKEVVAEKANLEAPGALEELTALGLAGAVETSTTLTWEACRRVGGPGADKKAKDALRAVGATKTSSYQKYEARAAKKAAKSKKDAAA